MYFSKYIKEAFNAYQIQKHSLDFSEYKKKKHTHKKPPHKQTKKHIKSIFNVKNKTKHGLQIFR